ncbi:MAG: hypothetical protein IPL61_34125 [Myxococcales bacterium]|nr:hypothetical protein [Myxococcales bacterium]
MADDEATAPPDLAYGNATTDITATEAGIPVGKQWIIGTTPARAPTPTGRAPPPPPAPH